MITLGVLFSAAGTHQIRGCFSSRAGAPGSRSDCRALKMAQLLLRERLRWHRVPGDWLEGLLIGPGPEDDVFLLVPVRQGQHWRADVAVEAGTLPACSRHVISLLLQCGHSGFSLSCDMFRQSLETVVWIWPLHLHCPWPSVLRAQALVIVNLSHFP